MSDAILLHVVLAFAFGVLAGLALDDLMKVILDQLARRDRRREG